MGSVEVRTRLNGELAAKIDDLVSKKVLGESRSAVCSALLERALGGEDSPPAKSAETIPSEGVDFDRFDQLISRLEKALEGSKPEDTNTQKMSKLVAGELGTFRAEFSKKVSELKSHNVEENMALLSQLKEGFNEVRKPIFWAGILASVFFGVISLFSALKIYSVEEAKRPIQEELKTHKEFHQGIKKLVCNSPSGRVDFSPVFVGQLCRIKVP